MHYVKMYIRAKKNVVLITFLILMLNTCFALTKEDCELRITIDQFTSYSRDIVPALEGTKKGDLGKIGVIGGSTEYAGAPYFSAISALKVGADLAYVITTEDAAPIIKSYSPDLIVYPYLNKRYASLISSLLPKLDIIIIGPGLGRKEEIMNLIYEIIDNCKTLNKPLVIDADGLFALSKNISVLNDYPRSGVILTPNHREASHLLDAVASNDTKWYKYWGQYVSVLTKGETDIFNSSCRVLDWSSSEGGSGRRAGGQGDILSGALGTFYAWALKSETYGIPIDHPNHIQFSQSVAAFASAKLTRLCNSRAYEQLGRGMLASDMIKEIHKSFYQLFN